MPFLALCRPDIERWLVKRRLAQATGQRASSGAAARRSGCSSFLVAAPEPPQENTS